MPTTSSDTWGGLSVGTLFTMPHPSDGTPMVWTVTSYHEGQHNVSIEAWSGSQSMMGGGEKTETFPYSIRRIEDE